MNKLRQQFVAALIGVGGICGTFGELQACGGRSGGGGYHRARPVVYSQPVQYRAPYQHPVYQQPIHQPQFAQVPQQQPAFQQQVNQLPPTVRRATGVGIQQGQPGQFSQGQLSQGQSPQFAQQQAGAQAGFNSAGGSALESLGGVQQAGGQGQFAQSQPQRRVANRPQTQPGQQQQQFAQQAPQQGAPQQQQQQAPQQQQQPQQQFAQQQAPQQQQTNPMGEAQRSALQALADMGDEVASADVAQPIDQSAAADAAQPVEQSQVESAGPVGQWKASLGNGSTVDLTLQSDGSFQWIATSNGKTSSFQGSYTLQGGLLTLVRSSDNQKLSGSLTASGSGSMNFKLNGAKDNGLNFQRS